MKESIGSRGFDRRGFLKTLGLISAGMLARPVAGVAAATGTSSRVGVLVPRSSLYPWLGESFVAGLRLGVAPSATELIVEDTGTRPGLAVDKCRRLVRDIKSDLVIALANADAADELAPLLRDSRAPLILATAGVGVHDPQTDSAIRVASLNVWQSHWALGEWAARHLGSRAMVAASMHESGYDAHYAFQMGFESAGGEVIAARVTDAPLNPGGVHAFLSEVDREQPDVVFANYSGHDAVPFMRAWAKTCHRPALVGSSFLADENVLPLLGDAALGVRSVAAWSPDSADALRKAGRTPDAFAVLGHECGVLVAEWAACGRLPVPASGSRPLYLREVTRRGNETVTELPRVDESHERILALQSSVRTGWINTYMSV